MFAIPSIAQLKKAVAISEQIQTLQAELATLLGASGKISAPRKSAATVGKKRKGKRRLSPEARARIAAVVKRRWAKVRKAQ